MKFFDLLKSKKQHGTDADDKYAAELELDNVDSDGDFRNGAFLNSLDELDESDIELNETAAKAEKGSLDRTKQIQGQYKEELLNYFSHSKIEQIIHSLLPEIFKQKSINIWQAFFNIFSNKG